MGDGGVQDVLVVLEGEGVGSGDEGEIVHGRPGEVKVRFTGRTHCAEALDDELVAGSEDSVRAGQALGQVNDVADGPSSGAALALDDGVGRSPSRGFVWIHDPLDFLSKVVGGGCNE